MMDTDTQILTVEQCETLQRHYLWSKLNDRPATISDTMFEPDGRRRGRVIKDAVTSGFLRPFGNDLWDGKTYEVTPEVMATVVPKLPHLLQMWAELHEKNSHREAYSRPWIRFEDLSIDDQFGVIDSDSVDWFVISTIPYQYQAQFASEHETVLANVPNGQSHNRYWAGPFASLNLANEHKTGKPSLGIAISSSELRVAVAERFSEAKLQRTFAANLLWGLVTMNIVPKDLVFDPDGKPTVDTQLVEGHAFRLSAVSNR